MDGFEEDHEASQDDYTVEYSVPPDIGILQEPSLSEGMDALILNVPTQLSVDASGSCFKDEIRMDGHERCGDYFQEIDCVDLSGSAAQIVGWDSHYANVESSQPPTMPPFIRINNAPDPHSNDFSSFLISDSHPGHWDDPSSQHSVNGYGYPHEAVLHGKAIHNSEQQTEPSFDEFAYTQADHGVEGGRGCTPEQHAANDVFSFQLPCPATGVLNDHNHRPMVDTAWPAKHSDPPWTSYSVNNAPPSVSPPTHDASSNYSTQGHTLSVPKDNAPGSRTSPTSSPAQSIFSVTPSNEDEVLSCLHGCGREFRGRNRRGSRSRHMRLKHGRQPGHEEKKYPCGVCRKVYLRQDARLNHQRGRHPELDLARPKSRKSGPPRK